MANAANLDIYIRAKNEAGKVLADVERQAGGVGKAFGDMTKIAGGFVMAQGIMAAPGFLMDAAQAAADDAASVAKLQQAVENSGAVWESYKGTLDTVVEAAQKRGFTDDQARDALALLTAQTGSAEEAAKRFAMAQDLARGANVDVYTASKLLGKVTEENVSVLSRYGIAAKEGMTQTELFGMIQQKFGGQAEAFASSTAGQMEAAKIQMSELKESIGYALLPVMTKLVDVLTADIIPAVQKLVDEWGPRLQEAFGAVKGVIEPVADALKGPMKEALTFLDEHKEILVAFAATVAVLLVPALWAWVAAEIAKTAAMLAAAAAFVLANAPIIAVAAAIGLLVLGIIELVKHWEDIWPKIKAVWDTVLGFFTGTVGPFFTETVPGFFTSLKDKVVGIVTDVMGWLKEHWQTIVTVALTILFPAAGGLFFIVTHFGEIKDKVTGLVSGLVTWLGDNWRTIVQVALAILFPPAGGLFWIATHFGEVKDSVLGFIGDIIGAIEALPGRVLAFLGAWAGAGADLAAGFVGAIRDGITGLVEAIPGMVGDLAAAFVNLIRDAWNAMIDWADANLRIDISGPFGIGIHWDPDLSIFRLAAGIRGFPGGLAWVGERGPELVALPRGSNVYSAPESRGMVGSGLARGINIEGDLVVNVNASSSDVQNPERLARRVAPALIREMGRYQERAQRGV